MVNSSHRIKLLMEAARKRAEEQVQQNQLEAVNLKPTAEVIHNAIEEQRNKFLPQKSSIDSLREMEDTISKFDWDVDQQEAIRLAEEGQSMILIGAAGTGKTTTVKAMIQGLIRSGKIGKLKDGTKHLKKDSPAVAFVSFTNRAVRNLIKSLPDHLKDNCLTIHKLIEFEPTDVEKTNEDGETYISKQFMPKRDRDNPILGLQYIVIDEASMVSTYLYAQLHAACPGAKYIYIGDLNQLAPVIGDAILGYKLSELPVVELKTVHRTAQDSKITMFAHEIKNGNAKTEKTLAPWAKEGELEFHPYKRDVTHNEASHALKKFFENEVESGRFDPETDIILCPYNKERSKDKGEYVSTRNINKAIASKYSEMNDEEVYEIIAGWEKHYYAVGDKIMFNKLEGKIIKIYPNKSYVGVPTLMPSKNIDRWGRSKDGSKIYVDLNIDEQFSLADDEDIDWDNVNVAGRVDESDEEATRKHDCSHKIVVSLETGETKTISASSDVNNKLSLGYCLSIHQSQGSEWKKVYLVLHSSHFIVSREMLYTGITRAREHLYCIYSKESTPRGTNGNFFKGVKRQEVKGKTLADKAEYFRSKLGKVQSNSALKGIVNIPQDDNLGMMDFK